MPEGEKALVEEHLKESPLGSPIWHCCGCLIIVRAFLLLGFVTLLSFLFGDSESTATDPREVLLEADFDALDKNETMDSDTVSNYLKSCIMLSLEGIETDEIKYYTKRDGGKVLVLVSVDDFKGVEKSSRKILVEALIECLDIYYASSSEYLDYYIGIDGRWNLLMVKTPFESDLGGSLAFKKDLFPFYDDLIEEESRDTLPAPDTLEIDLE